MKKLFNKLKDSKVVKKFIGPVIETIADIVPFGGVALKAVKGVANNIYEDKNKDGKVQLNEINWSYAATFFVIVLLLRFEIVSVDILLEAAKIILELVGGG